MKSEKNFSYKQHLKFIFVFLSSFLFFLFFLLSINIYIDPRGIFGTGKYPILVATARTEKILLLKSVEQKPQALIFGSSHCMRYSPKYVENVTGLKTFNCSVNSGKIEDFLALLNFALSECNIHPKLIILGVCPRTFCEIQDEDFDERLLSNATLINYIPLNSIPRIQKKAGLFLNTLNFGYLKDVRRSFVLSQKQNLPLKFYTFESDGFLRFEEKFNEKGAFIAKDLEVTGFSKNRIEFFETFLKLCRQNNIKLKIIITPYAPDYIKQQAGGNHDRLNQLLAEMLKNYNKEHSFEFYNFPHIEDYGGVDEFMGSAHPSIYNSTLILKKCLTGFKES
ncbi:MAG: hypothetical protein BWY69_00316 [Planctomycetes bacterium ADurb.Bin401]|nr:MAG: hypothetical protein BWY69_00316 [Planctomycetes bacterium ADurb.Bin401]